MNKKAFKPVVKKGRFPVYLVDSMDLTICFDTIENAKWYHDNWPNLPCEEEATEYGTMSSFLRDGKLVGQRWDAY